MVSRWQLSSSCPPRFPHTSPNLSHRAGSRACGNMQRSVSGWNLSHVCISEVSLSPLQRPWIVYLLWYALYIKLIKSSCIASAPELTLSTTAASILSCAQRNCPINDSSAFTRQDVEFSLWRGCGEEQIRVDRESCLLPDYILENTEDEDKDEDEDEDIALPPAIMVNEPGKLELRSTPPETMTMTVSVIIQTASSGPAAATVTNKGGSGSNGGTVLDQGGSGAGNGRGLGVRLLVGMVMCSVGIVINAFLWWWAWTMRRERREREKQCGIWYPQCLFDSYLICISKPHTQLLALPSVENWRSSNSCIPSFIFMYHNHRPRLNHRYQHAKSSAISGSSPCLIHLSDEFIDSVRAIMILIVQWSLRSSSLSPVQIRYMDQQAWSIQTASMALYQLLRELLIVVRISRQRLWTYKMRIPRWLGSEGPSLTCVQNHRKSFSHRLSLIH